jgi:hypothetical protein
VRRILRRSRKFLGLLLLACLVGLGGSALGHAIAAHNLASYAAAPLCHNSFYRQCHSVRHIVISRLHRGYTRCLHARFHDPARCGDYTYLSYRYRDLGGLDSGAVEVSTHSIPAEFAVGRHATLDLYGTVEEELRAADGARLTPSRSAQQHVTYYGQMEWWTGAGAGACFAFLLVSLFLPAAPREQVSDRVGFR